MVMKKICILFLTVALSGFCTCFLYAAGESGSTIQIHLPRQVSVEKKDVTIGDVSVIFGDAILKSKAEKIQLGRITFSGQNLVIEKETILARLACSGVSAKDVKLTGAEKVVVNQNGYVVEDDKIIQAARMYLGDNPPAEDVCFLQPVRSGGDLEVDKKVDKLNFKCVAVKGTSANYSKVKVSIFDGDKYLCDREVNFRLKFRAKRATTKEILERGQLMTKDNIIIEEYISDYPTRNKWVDPVGLVTKRRLAKGVVVKSDMTAPKKSSVIIKRNENIMICVEKYGFVVSVLGKVLENGSDGDLIRVRNVDSNRIITVKINPDGTASPVI